MRRILPQVHLQKPCYDLSLALSLSLSHSPSPSPSPSSLSLSLNLNFDATQGTPTSGYAELRCHTPMMAAPSLLLGATSPPANSQSPQSNAGGAVVPQPPAAAGGHPLPVFWQRHAFFAADHSTSPSVYLSLYKANLNFDGAEGTPASGYAQLQCHTPAMAAPSSLPLSRSFSTARNARPTSTSMLHKGPPQVDRRSCSAIRR